MSEFGSGDAIGVFTVLCPCGAGAFGQVYLVRDASGKHWALKLLSPDRRGERELDGVLRFQRVKHPNLLHIDRFSTLPDGRVFYTMEPADNAGSAEAYAPDTLARRLRERGTIPADGLRSILLELAAGLAALHREHLLHRDIKPENILFVRGRAVLADAGATGEFDGTTLIGTPGYLPSEVCLQQRRFAAADDCYALGKVLYTALTGEPPHKFPGTPRTLNSPEEIALFKVAERACTPPGVSAYKFRELLEHPEALRRSFSTRRLVTAAAVLLAAAVPLAVAFVAVPGKAPAPAPAPAPTAETPAEPTATELKASVAYSRSFVQKLKTDEAKLRAEQERMKSPTVQPVGMKRRNEDNAAEPRAAELNASVEYSRSFVQKLKTDEAKLRAEQERMKSPTVQPVGMKRRNEDNAAEPRAAELMEKYRLSAEEQKLVDKWLAEYVAFDRLIKRAMWDKAKIAELTKERKAKLPYGIDDFCGYEKGTRPFIDLLTTDYNPGKRKYLESALRNRRRRFKELIEKLPAAELAKWR